ncbi:MAG: hypothetical protein CL534_20080 [Ahrensia sp.]|nr:hypothetical protein [Ahrensia sp.]
MTHTALIRPAWTPATIALMVLGFIIFWPLGLAMLAYILWGDRLDEFKRDVNMKTDEVFKGCSGIGRKRRHRHNHYNARTGNVAFDDWREGELKRLEEERRKLDTMREEFDSYMRELRRAKDQEEFDRFMRDRQNRPSGDNGNGNGPSVPNVTDWS